MKEPTEFYIFMTLFVLVSKTQGLTCDPKGVTRCSPCQDEVFTICPVNCGHCTGNPFDARNNSTPADLIAIPFADTYDEMIKDTVVQIAMREVQKQYIIEFFDKVHQAFEDNANKCQSCNLSNLTKVSKKAATDVKSESRNIREVAIRSLKRIQQELGKLEEHVVSFVKPGTFGSNHTCPA